MRRPSQDNIERINRLFAMGAQGRIFVVVLAFEGFVAAKYIVPWFVASFPTLNVWVKAGAELGGLAAIILGAITGSAMVLDLLLRD